MRTLALFLVASAPVWAASFPPGVTYPLQPAAIQPSGLAQPLPSTRRYVLIWKDQLADVVQGVTSMQKDWLVVHYVGTQKLFAHQIDEYRQKNPNFLLLVYHLAYGLNGADQTNPVGNITGPEKYGQEDTDSFTPWVAASGATRENAFQHGTATGFPSNRIFYPDPYWLMDISSTEWRTYLSTTLLQWQAFPSTKATGVFLDAAFHPWYQYQPAQWWSTLAGGSSHPALATWWNPRAAAYFDALRAAFAAGNGHPRYLVIPNPDSLIDEEPTFLDSTDGVFTENWQAITGGTGDWAVSARRLCRYVTGAGKTWIVDVTVAGTSLSIADRELLIGTYLLVRNGTSYYDLGGDDVSWYPEYEIDLGGYEAEPPADLEALRVAGAGGGAGGLYARRYVRGLVLVNSSTGALSYDLPTAMKRAVFSGGGTVSGSGVEAAQTLTYTADVAAGMVSVPPHAVLILRDPAGAPPPGEEPGGTTNSDGGAGPTDAAVMPGQDLTGRTDDAAAGTGATPMGCGCHVARAGGADGRAVALLALTLLGSALLLRRRR